jgi:hypothetical protein
MISNDCVNLDPDRDYQNTENNILGQKAPHHRQPSPARNLDNCAAREPIRRVAARETQTEGDGKRQPPDAPTATIERVDVADNSRPTRRIDSVEPPRCDWLYLTRVFEAYISSAAAR